MAYYQIRPFRFHYDVCDWICAARYTFHPCFLAFCLSRIATPGTISASPGYIVVAHIMQPQRNTLTLHLFFEVFPKVQLML